MNLRDLGGLTLLGALWGASFLFIRVAVPILGPVFLVDARVTFTSLVLLFYALAIHRLPDFKKSWPKYILLSIINAVIPFCLISMAELNLTASLASILNATTPLFTALVAAVWLKDPFTLKKGLGLLLGLVGVAVVMGWSPVELNVTLLLSAGMSLLAALSYGFGGVFVKVGFSGTPPLTMAIGQQLAAGIVLLPLASFNLPTKLPGLDVIISLAGLVLLSTALAYLIYFNLNAKIGPTNASSVTFLVPVFGLLWGVIFLNEPVGFGLFLGLGIIMVSLILVTGFSFKPLVRNGTVK